MFRYIQGELFLCGVARLFRILAELDVFIIVAQQAEEMGTDGGWDMGFSPLTRVVLTASLSRVHSI